MNKIFGNINYNLFIPINMFFRTFYETLISILILIFFFYNKVMQYIILINNMIIDLRYF
jgi:hypothetical protein